MNCNRLNINMGKILLGLMIGLVALMPVLAGCAAPAQKPLEPATPVTFTPGEPLDKNEMRITFMGTSVIPRIAQQCNSVFVELGNGDSFMFDIGSGVSSKYVAMGIPYSRMDKLFLTHLHGDHMSDIITLYCFGPSIDRKTPLEQQLSRKTLKSWLNGTWKASASLQPDSAAG
jgi:hypothetical protein